MIAFITKDMSESFNASDFSSIKPTVGELVASHNLKVARDSGVNIDDVKAYKRFVRSNPQCVKYHPGLRTAASFGAGALLGAAGAIGAGHVSQITNRVAENTRAEGELKGATKRWLLLHPGVLEQYAEISGDPSNKYVKNINVGEAEHMQGLIKTGDISTHGRAIVNENTRMPGVG